MNEILERNSAVLQQRWPQLWQQLSTYDPNSLQIERCEGLEVTLKVNGLQLCSRHNRREEAEQQAATLPNNPLLYLYGTGFGELPRVLLERPTLKHLEVKILNAALFLLLLNLLEQQDWLSDPRVQLSMAKDEAEIKKPFFALPPELLLAEPLALGIRDRLLGELTLNASNQRFKALHPEKEMQARLQANKKWLRKDADVKALFGTAKGKSAYILAAGPSLNENIAKLKILSELPHSERPLFIAVDTACRALFLADIQPDIVVSIDYRIHKGFFASHRPIDKVKLVYFPMVETNLLEFWPGPHFAAYGTQERYRSLRQQIPKATLFSAGSVIHPATYLALKMGCSEIIFFGADFGFPNEQTHASWNNPPKLTNTFKNIPLQTLNGHGQLIATAQNFTSYRYELERLIADNPEVKFFNSSRSGAEIKGCTYHPEFAAHE